MSTDVAERLDVWALVGERCDVAMSRPRLAADIEVRRFDDSRAGPYTMVCNPRSVSHLRLSVAEGEMLACLDGTHTVAEVVAERFVASGELDVDAVVDLVRVLDAGEFFTTSFVDVDAAVATALSPLTVRRRAEKFFRTLTVDWSGAEGLVRWLYRWLLKPLFTPIGVVLAALVAVAGLVAFVVVAATRDFHLSSRHVGVAFVVLLVLDLVIIFIHELGHAAVLVHHRRRVKSAGFRIYFGAPSFFIESSDALMLPRRQRIMQSLMGPWFEFVAAGIGAIVLLALPAGAAADTFYTFVVINYYVLLLNLIPLLELDGYWILSDALGIADLRPRSLAFVRRDLWHKLARRQRFTRGEIGLALYGTLGVLFTIFCLASAWFFWQRVFGDAIARMWNNGWGGRALLVILVVVLGGPAIRAVLDATRSLFAALYAAIDRLRFRFTRRWRIEAAELLDESGVFGDLPVEVLNDLAGRVSLQNVAAGQRVIRQGDIGDAYYLIRKGVLDAIDEPPDGEPIVLQTLRRGEGFGEAALLHAAPRNASVRARVRSQIYRITKGTFDQLLADHAQVGAVPLTLQRRLELRGLAPFAHLGDTELAAVAEHGEWITVAAGDDIIRQGDPGDAFFVIGTGQADAIRDGQTIDHLQAGNHFGETALLTNKARNATIRAATAGRIFRISRDGFDALVAAQFHRGALEPRTMRQIWDH